MSLGNTAENDIQALLWNATALPAAWPASGGNFYVALHTADPGEGGSPTTSEATYTGYARVAITRNSSGFTVTNNVAANTSAVTFAQCTAGSNTITHFSIVSSASGAGTLFGSGALTASLAVSAGIIPQFAASALTLTLD